MNICMVSDDFIPSKTGVGVFIKLISKELALRGHNVVVLTTRRQGEPKFEIWNEVRVYRLFSIKIVDFHVALASKKRIKKILQNHKIQIVHFNYLGVLLWQAHAAASSLGLKQTYNYQMTVEHLTQDSKFLKLFSRLISQAIVRFCNSCDWLTTPSRYLIQRLNNDRISTHIHHINNPIGFEEYLIPNTKTQQKKFIALYVGRLHPEKNIDYLIEAFSLFSAECPESELWIVGDGTLRQQLEDQTFRLGLNTKIKFFGQIEHSQIVKFYLAASVFILPSLVEVQPFAAIEAMSTGLPVILTNSIVSARELVLDRENGFIVDSTSFHDLANKMEILYHDKSLCRRMGEVSKIKSKEFSVDQIVNSFEELYSTSLEPGLVATLEEAQKLLSLRVAEIREIRQRNSLLRSENLELRSEIARLKNDYPVLEAT